MIIEAEKKEKNKILNRKEADSCQMQYIQSVIFTCIVIQARSLYIQIRVDDIQGVSLDFVDRIKGSFVFNLRVLDLLQPVLDLFGISDKRAYLGLG